MALNALIRGPGPDYTLPGEAPTDGQTFQANAQGLVEWGGMPLRPRPTSPR